MNNNKIIDDGGPASPSSPSVGPNDQLYRPVDIGCSGLSIRDYFAAKAMQSLLTSSNYDSRQVFEATREAYFVADAMMEARNEQRQNP